MTEFITKHSSLLIRIGLSVGLLIFLGFAIDLTEMANLLADLRWSVFILLLVLALVERLLNTYKWQLLVHAHDNSLTLWQLFRIQMTSGCLGLFLPSSLGVDALRMIAIAKCTDKPLQAIAASAVDRAISVFMNILLASICALLAAGSYLTWPLAAVFPLILLAGCIVVATITQPFLKQWIAPILQRILGTPITKKISEFYEYFTEYRSHKPALLGNAALFVLIILLRVLLVYLQAYAFNISIDLWPLFLVLPLVWVALMLPISIGGLGLQEGAYFMFLGAIGISGSAAVAISLLEHLIVRITSLPGLYFYLRGGLAGGKVHSKNVQSQQP